MIVIETCPQCGNDLQDVLITTNPPIPKKECWKCGWSWTGEMEKEEVIRIPYSRPVSSGFSGYVEPIEKKGEISVR